MANVLLRLLLLTSLILFTSAIPSRNAGGSSVDVSRISGRNTQRPDLAAAKVQAEELNNKYWHDRAKEVLKEQIEKVKNTNKAKNIIFFLGDGMGHASVAAARMALGAEEKKLSFEEFPFTANSKTYCVDLQVADSACSSTAYLNGVKARGSTIGVNAMAQMGNCFDSMNTSMHTESIASWAMKDGKDAGFVTTTRVTHASPAGAYSHISYRHWETDYDISLDRCSADFNDDIAEQLIHGEVGKKLKEIFGCGSRSFINQTMTEHNGSGRRRDGKNLLEDYKQMNPSRIYVNNREQLLNLNAAEVGEVLGLFDSSHCTYKLDVEESNLQNEKPSLTDMTKKAVEILSQNENGYFLFVEGGRIDHGHHSTYAKQALSETIEFSNAIQAAVDMVDLEDTLIIVTADHSHSFTIAGYAPRGSNIYGLAGTADDNMSYMTLSYANGPGYNTHWNETGSGSRVDPSTLNRTSSNFRFPSPLPRVEETHAGEDVGIWAIGPWAHLFQGTLEQHAIPHILAYAACIGDGMTACK